MDHDQGVDVTQLLYRVHVVNYVLCICLSVTVFCHVAKSTGQKDEEKKPKKAAKSLRVLDPKAAQNLCKYLLFIIFISVVCYGHK